VNFKSYLWLLIPRPLKLEDDGEISRLADALAELFTRTRSSLWAIRLSWSAPTASGVGLDLIGADRGIARLSGETDADYSVRLVNAFHLHQRGGTPPGLVPAVEAMGFTDVQLIEGPYGPRHNGVYRYNGAVRHSALRWAEFAVKFTLPDGLSFDATVWKNLLRTIAQWKAGHTMCKYFAVGWSAVDQSTSVDELLLSLGLTWQDDTQVYARHNGLRRHNGTFAYDGDSDKLQVVVQ
jgi:hypothetical protein